MTFRRVPPNFDYRATRLVSEGGRWELGLSPYAGGMRLRMGAAGRPPKVVDFCLGTDPAVVMPALVAVLRLLEPVDEQTDAAGIDRVFPWAGTRPDPARHLAGLLSGPAGGEAGIRRESGAGAARYQPHTHSKPPSPPRPEPEKAGSR